MLAPKAFSWGGSFEARMSIAVLRINEPDLYIELLSKVIGIGINVTSTLSAMLSLIKMRSLKKKKTKKQTEHQNKLSKDSRMQQHKDDKSSTSGYDFGHGKI